MKKVNGTFVGKMKVNYDSKYIHGTGLDEDIAETQRKIKSFKQELETAIDECYKKHVRNFRMYETAIQVLQETIRDKFLEYEERL